MIISSYMEVLQTVSDLNVKISNSDHKTVYRMHNSAVGFYGLKPLFAKNFLN